MPGSDLDEIYEFLDMGGVDGIREREKTCTKAWWPKVAVT